MTTPTLTIASYNVHYRGSPTYKLNVPTRTLGEAVRAYDQIAADHKAYGRRPLIYAILSDGTSVPVPTTLIDQTR